MVLHVTARMEAQEDKADEMETVLIELAEKSRPHEGAIQYDFFRAGSSFLSIEIWQDKKCLDAHAATDEFKQAGKQLASLMSAKPEIITWKKLG